MFIFIYPIILIFSQKLAVPFHLTIKLPTILADIGIVYLLYRIGQLKSGNRLAQKYSLLYCLNPVSILISAFHGNIITVAVFFTLLTYYLFLFKKETSLIVLSGLVLGLGIGWRNFPILLLPIFLKKIKQTKQKLIFCALALFPAIITFLPFIPSSLKLIYSEVLNYNSVIDHGWLAIFRLQALKTSSNDISVQLSPFLALSKKFFLLLYFLYILYRQFINKSTSLLKDINLVFLLFYSIYAGIASQYLIWIAPFLLILNLRYYLIYSLITTISLVGFYLYFFPWLLLNSYSNLWSWRQFINIKLGLNNISVWAVLTNWLTIFSLLILIFFNRKKRRNENQGLVYLQKKVMGAKFCYFWSALIFLSIAINVIFEFFWVKAFS